MKKGIAACYGTLKVLCKTHTYFGPNAKRQKCNMNEMMKRMNTINEFLDANWSHE